MNKVAWGLLAAWIVHDLEELATMPSFSQSADLPLAAVVPLAHAIARLPRLRRRRRDLGEGPTMRA